MPTELDVYRDWLGIKESARPLNHYQLLRLKTFEDDPGKIRGNYRKMNSHVRKYAAGEFSQQSQELLNELAKAMLCLTDAKRKSEYDASLGRSEEAQRRRFSLEQILVGRKIVTPDQLSKAKNYANAIGIELRDAVVQQKMATPDVAMQAYAEAEGLPYVDLDDVPIETELAPQIPVIIARKHTCVPVMIDDGTLLMASPNPLRPDVEEELRLRTGYPVRTVLCTVGKINDMVDTFFPKSALSADQAALTAGPAKGEAAGSPSATDTPTTPGTSGRSTKQQRLMITMVVYLICLFIGSIAFGSTLYGVALGAIVAGLAYVIIPMFF